MVTIIPSIPHTTMDALCAQLTDCQSPVAAVRQAAEQALVQAQGTPGFLPQLLQIAVQGPPQCQLQAAILLKNNIQRLWIDPNNASAQRARITEEDRTYLKAHLVRYLVDSPLQLQKQLAACVTVISSHDFPAQWQNLLPELIAHLSATEHSKIRAVLTTLQDITQPYRYKGKGNELWTQIKYVLVNTAQPLLECLVRLATQLSQAKAQQDRNEVITMITLLANVFLSLSFQDIPEQFEDKLSDWMGHWLGFLTMERGEGPARPVITKHEEIVDPPQPVDDLQGVICEIGSLYAEKYEEEFRPFVPNWVSTVYQLLITVGGAMLPRHDPVMVGGLHFMTQIVSRPWNKHLFADPERLRAICESIIMPNLTLQQQDIAMFYHNPIEYVRRDSEGSDHATRRRLTCDLVRALTVQFQSEISQCLYSYVTVLLQNFQKSPDADWIQADAAMYVVLALAVQGRTQEKGATIVNQYVNVAEFYQSHVQPQLADPQIERFPILKADAIKFVSTFRSHFPVEQCRDLIPVLSKFLASHSFVVHSYAASAIERLLALKNCITKEHLKPFSTQMLTQLFSALDHEESSENDYLLRALMRVLYVSGSNLLPFLETLLSKLTGILIRVAVNPRNPMFNHLLFECIAVLIRLCKEHPELVPNFQAALFPPFQTMLQAQEACNEFGSYVFQIMCMILDCTPGEAVPPAFEALYPMLMSPALWDSQGNVHAITQLLQAYLRKPGFVVTLCPTGGATTESSNRLTALLGVFQKLIASTLNDKFGMALLRSMIRHVPWAAGLQPYMKQILVLVFTRATSSSTSQFGRAFALFLADFITVRGFNVVLSEMEGVQAGISFNVIGKMFLPQAALIVQPAQDRKLIHVALVHMACHNLDVVINGGQPYVQMWVGVIDCLLDQLELGSSSTEQPAFSDDQAESILEQLSDGSTPAYSAAYSRLAFAIRVDTDAFPQIQNMIEYFVKSLADATRSRPGQIRSMLESNLPPARVSLIHELCSKFMVQLV